LDPADCPLKATLFIWDEVNNTWLDKSASTSQPWVGFLTADSSPNKAGRVSIYQDSSSFVDEKVYTVKIRITDLKASDPEAIAIEHTFQVDVYHACARNTLAFSSDQINKVFTINADTSTSTQEDIPNSAVTTAETEAICPLNRILEIFDPSKQSWVQYTSSLTSTYPWITSWTDPVGSLPGVYTSSSNGFTVKTNDFATFDNFDSQPSVF